MAVSEYNQGRGNLYAAVYCSLYSIMARASHVSSKRGQKTPSFDKQGDSYDDKEYEKSISEAQNFVPTAIEALTKWSFCDQLEALVPEMSPNSSQIWSINSLGTRAKRRAAPATRLKSAI